MTREDLRKQFKEETNIYPVVGMRQPYSKHIEWLEDKVIALTKAENLPISGVSHQRELLVAFCKYLEKEGGNGFVSPEFLADDFLSNQ